MKQKKCFWRYAARGFTVTLILLSAAAGSVYGMAVAQQNTRAAGFGDPSPALVLTRQDGRVTLRLFDWEITF